MDSVKSDRRSTGDSSTASRNGDESRWSSNGLAFLWLIPEHVAELTRPFDEAAFRLNPSMPP
jgi:hypothetical protein